jgi:hypothetical protein
MKHNLKNIRSFEITYISPTNFKGSRISILDNRFKLRVMINYDHNFNNIYEIALNYLNSIGIKCIYMSEFKKGYLLLTNDFITQIKDKKSIKLNEKNIN